MRCFRGFFTLSWRTINPFLCFSFSCVLLSCCLSLQLLHSTSAKLPLDAVYCSYSLVAQVQGSLPTCNSPRHLHSVAPLGGQLDLTACLGGCRGWTQQSNYQEIWGFNNWHNWKLFTSISVMRVLWSWPNVCVREREEAPVQVQSICSTFWVLFYS